MTAEKKTNRLNAMCQIIILTVIKIPLFIKYSMS